MVLSSFEQAKALTDESIQLTKRGPHVTIINVWPAFYLIFSGLGDHWTLFDL
jgi:hypothetical protein